MFGKSVVKLTINEKLYTVSSDVPPDTTLNAYIRDYVHAKGTKYMCQEGGCGACIVAVKRINPLTKRTEIFAINSCLPLIYSCYGWSIITVEGIGNQRYGFHKVQSTLAAFSGTQCGYCSPGMVMNMFSLLNSERKITMQQVENSFGGNICRCTGYRPILDAFKSLASDASQELKQNCVDIEDILCEMKICPKSNEKCDNICAIENGMCDDESTAAEEIPNNSFSIVLADDTKWFKVKSIQEIYDVFDMVTDTTKYMLLCGRTSHGVYRITDKMDIYIDINDVSELHDYKFDSATGALILGANMTLSNTIALFEKVAVDKADKFSYLKELANHIDLVANVPVRNMGTLAGNLSIKYSHREFPSDIFLILEAANAQLTIGHVSGMVYDYSLRGYLELNMLQRVIHYIKLPALDSSYVYKSYKIMRRAQNTHAYVNAAFLVKANRSEKFRVEQKPNIVFGGINQNFVHASQTEDYLDGKILLDDTVIKEACRILQSELQPDSDPLDASPQFRKSLAVNLLYKFVLSLSPQSVSSKYRSGGSLLKRAISSGKQDFQTDKSMWPVTKPVLKLEAFLQCSGEAEYVNDMLSTTNELYAAFVVNKSGPAQLTSIDISQIKNMPGVVKFLSAKDIPGKNTYTESNGPVVEELFASKEIKFAGQPVGLVIAKTQNIANKAADKVVVNVKNQRKAIVDFVQIVESNDQSRIFKEAEKPPTEKKNDIKYKFNGKLLMGGQYHYTMETQTCYCVPSEDGIDVYPSSQWIDGVQANVAVVLALPRNSVNVSVKRVGGGYGSKLGRSALVAAGCAVAANNVKVPVKMVMTMETNMETIGKRFPMYGKYEVAVNEKGEIQYLDLYTYSDRGLTRNEPTFGFIVLHAPNCYNKDVWMICQNEVLTDKLPHTYVRAPGSTEAIGIIEYIMEHIAYVTKQDPVDVRLANLNAKHSIVASLIDDIKQNCDYENRKKFITTFNKENRWKKRGISLLPMCYPYACAMSYHVLISVFGSDGTVAVTHGGIEIGQGINTKVAQACAFTLGIDLSLIKLKSTTAMTSPNDGATGGSMASDGATMAAIGACKILLDRLQPIKDENPGLRWKELIAKAVEASVDLCCEYMYSPKPVPVSYNIYGVGVTEVEVDILTGQHQILRVDILEDCGQSISPNIDIGQVEGAFVMGLGYWLNEKLVYDSDTGKLLTNRSWNYTPPGAKDIPIDFRVYFRRNAPNPVGVLRSKATGEPPLCLSVSAVFAIRNALASARQDASNTQDWFDIDLPYSPENVLLTAKTWIDQFNL